jgi:Ca2+-binding EF-hand superfamily protein
MIDTSELENVLKHCKIKSQVSELNLIFEVLDTDHDGKITYVDFCEVIEGKKNLDLKNHFRSKFADTDKSEIVDTRIGEDGMSTKKMSSSIPEFPTPTKSK